MRQRNTVLRNREGRRLHLVGSAALIASFMLWSAATRIMADASAELQARDLFESSGVRGGLIVHLGCGDGRLTAALRVNDRCLVHGLTTDLSQLRSARQFLLARGEYGAVSVDLLREGRLPYSDGVVQMVVAERADLVSPAEVMRVLAPGGVVCTRRGSSWRTQVKPRDSEMDEWTHFLHDASNNPVGADSRIGPPRGLQWLCGPLWARSHEFTSSLLSLVSGGGRLFYIIDEGLTGVTDGVPDRWMLVARDAYSGVLLWKRPLPGWSVKQWRGGALRRVPTGLPRRLVAAGDRVFITLEMTSAVAVLDAASGKSVSLLQATAGADELRWSDPVLLVRLRGGTVVAVDSQSGAELWRSEDKAQPGSLAAHGDRVAYAAGKEVVCRSIREGEVLWRLPVARTPSLVILHGGQAFLLVGGRILAVEASSGREMWRSAAAVQRNELFVAGDKLWHYSGKSIIGLSLQTGDKVAEVDPSGVFTPGHHFRCYPSKATESFLITPNRGAEFISLEGGNHAEADWVRGACRYGIMPANGLLYAPPDPCFCYPGVKLTGFTALSSQGAPADEAHPLERGPAFSAQVAETALAGDWPTFRHDPRRSGATAVDVSPRVRRRWSVTLQGRLTQPVVAGGRVFVAAIDSHTLHALRAQDGREAWRFTAGARIDSPPTVYGGTVLVGSADGWVYALRARDGALCWRFRAAPLDRRIVAFNQLESKWPVHGSVLVTGGVAYVVAGRSSYLDGGLWLFGLDPATGQVRCRARVDSWAPTRKDAERKPFIPGYVMEGATSDILVSEGGAIFLGQLKFDLALRRQPAPYIIPIPGEKVVAIDVYGQPYSAPDREPDRDYEQHQRQWLERTQPELLSRLKRQFGGYSLGDRRLGRHLFAMSGFLDDSWFNRTFWMYSEIWPGYYLAHRAAKQGQLLVVGPRKTYAIQAYPSRNLQSPLFTPGERGYLLIADDNDNEPVLDSRTRGTTKGWGFTRARPPVWHRWAPIRVRAMVLAGSSLFVAGPPDVVDADDPMAAFEGRAGGVLQSLSAADGTPLQTMRLDSPPVFDGLIAAEGGLLVSTVDGRVARWE